MAGSPGGTASRNLHQPRARRRARRQRLAAVAVLLAVACVAGSAAKSAQAAPFSPRGASATRALYAGIPQDGITLGRKSAPVTLVEFADLQCPFCGRYSRNVLPSLVRRYVRPGRVNMVFVNLTFVGSDSVRAARVAAATGQQDKLWQFTDLMYRNQRRENSGYATDDYLRGIAAGCGASAGRAMSARSSVAVSTQLAQAHRLATALRVNGVPAFLIALRGRPAQPFLHRSLTVGEFSAALDAALAATGA